MRKVVMGGLVAGALLISVLGQSASAQMEIRVGGEGVFPGNTDDWDIGYGASAQLIFWHPSGLGLALSAGYQQWDVNDDIESFGKDLGGGSGYGYAAGLDGDASMVPLGASGLYRIALGESANLTLEGGLRYVIVSSDVTFVEAEAYVDARGNTLLYTDSYKIDFDNGIVAVAAADLDVEVSQGFKLFAGAGYQFDVMKGDSSVNGYDLDYKNKLKAAFVRIGLAVDL